VAHELNNPLMAVAGWAELAVRRGAPEPELRALVDATARTADAVARLQLLVRSGRGPETTR
jgi:signal transduction histidine kinase